MKDEVLNFIGEQVRCFDGATGTALFRKGIKAGTCLEEAPAELIQEVHREYLESGAEFVTTNTFGATRYKLANFGLEKKVKEINKRNAQLARELANKRYYVAGTIGPTGRFIQPFGELTFEEFLQAFAEQVEGLLDGGVDLFIVETMMDREELRAALQAARQTGLVVIGCMTFETTAKGYRTLMGVSPQEAVQVLEGEGADVVGTNCGLSPVDMLGLAKELRPLTQRPLLVQPNAGPPKLVNGKTVYEPVENIEECLEEIVGRGANLVGGCCGTDQHYVRTLRKIVDRHNKEQTAS